MTESRPSDSTWESRRDSALAWWDSLPSWLQWMLSYRGLDKTISRIKQLKSETEQIRNETEQIRNETEQLRNERLRLRNEDEQRRKEDERLAELDARIDLLFSKYGISSKVVTPPEQP